MRLRVRVVLAVAVSLIAPASASAEFPHTVTSGESLSSIAESDGLTVEQLAAANGLEADASLIAGSTLMIPPQQGEAPESLAANGETTGTEGGETAGTESAESTGTETSPESNGGFTGDGDSDSDDVSSSLATSSQPEGTEAEASSGGPPFPTAETVSPEEVGSIAAENGVPASLVAAIADQESGFNNDLVSSANARGVMQILPGTWSWINEHLTSSSPLDPNSATSNVRGGVLLLHSLLESTGGDTGLAAAGYYQGLPSVLEEGELPSTQQYVESVRSLQQQFGGE
jgi:LysM repeat protein